MAIIIDAALRYSAMVEAVMIATEAKTVALRRLNIRSPISGEIATGTGTDAIAIIAGSEDSPIAYCGKHVVLGEMFAQAVIAALMSSLNSWRPTSTQ